jgi:hypothetical protein
MGTTAPARSTHNWYDRLPKWEIHNTGVRCGLYNYSMKHNEGSEDFGGEECKVVQTGFV